METSPISTFLLIVILLVLGTVLWIGFSYWRRRKVTGWTPTFSPGPEPQAGNDKQNGPSGYSGSGI